MVLAKFTGKTYCFLAKESHDDISVILLSRIAELPNAIYIYEDVLAGRELHDKLPDDQDPLAHGETLEDYYTYYEHYYLPTPQWQHAH